MLVTQPMVRQAQNQNLDPANLFFDSESRAIQSSAAADDDANQAQSLAMTAKLMALVNRMQTTAQDARLAAASAQAAHVPPPLPPTLFAAPEKHQVVPGVRPPEARSRPGGHHPRGQRSRYEFQTTQTHRTQHILYGRSRIALHARKRNNRKEQAHGLRAQRARQRSGPPQPLGLAIHVGVCVRSRRGHGGSGERDIRRCASASRQTLA